MHGADTYGIIDIAQIDSVDFSQVPEQRTTIRTSIDGSKFVIKWESGHEPTFIADGSVTPLQTLTHAECLALMATAEWSEPVE
jgi:hypothetical protein